MGKPKEVTIRDKTMELGDRCRNRNKRGNRGIKHLNEEQGEQWGIVYKEEKMCKLGPLNRWNTSFQGGCKEKQGLAIRDANRGKGH